MQYPARQYLAKGISPQRCTETNGSDMTPFNLPKGGDFLINVIKQKCPSAKAKGHFL